MGCDQSDSHSDMRRIKVEYGPNFTCVKSGWMDKYHEAWDLLD